MPPDRVFGRIEKDFRKRECILSPCQYYEILRRHGTVRVLGLDYEMFDYQSECKRLLKSRLPFRIQEQRVFTYTKKSLGVRNVYSSEPTIVGSLFKKGKSFPCPWSPPKVPRTNHVKPEKRKDVERLLQFFDIPDGAQEFYNTVLQQVQDAGNDDEGDVYDEEESFL